MSVASIRSFAAPSAARRIPERRVVVVSGASGTPVAPRCSNRQFRQQRRRTQRAARGVVSIASIPPSSSSTSTDDDGDIAPGSPPPGFSAPGATSFRLAVLGDLHYDPRDAEAFEAAREQLARVLREKAGEGNGGGSEENVKGTKNGTAAAASVVSRLVQLGDLGASSFSPGTPQCFRHAREFLGAASLEGEAGGAQGGGGGGGEPSPFAPPALVVGNHDLEGTTFDEIGFRFSGSPALSSPSSSKSSSSVVISSYSGDSSDDEEDDENLSFADNARTRPYPSALAAAEAADAANLRAWRRAFQQHHHWRAELGRVVLLGVSTTRFRSNANSVHEVHVDGAQFRWLEGRISEAEREGRPVVVFTHAPPAGCGLRVVQAVHVRNRCAYLNHGALDREGFEEQIEENEESPKKGSTTTTTTSALPPPPPPPAPDAFIRLVERHANVRLWLSGHYHLSHNYSSSVSSVGGCVFAQVGVIGPRSTRDGLRQSRVLDADGELFELRTLDHDTGELRTDVRGTWEWRRRKEKSAAAASAASVAAVEILPVPEDELLDPAADAAWLSSQVDCDAASSSSSSESSWPAPGGDVAASSRGSPAEKQRQQTQWLPAGGDALLAFNPSKGEVLEYSARMRCPVGFVLDKLPTTADCAGLTRARLVDAEGEEVYPNFTSSSSSSSDGDVDADAAAARAAAVEVVVASTGQVVGRRGRNAKGSFYHVYQANKWRKKVAELVGEESEKSSEKKSGSSVASAVV